MAISILLPKRRALPGNAKSSTLNTAKKTEEKTTVHIEKEASDQTQESQRTASEAVADDTDEEENFDHLDKEFKPTCEPVKKKSVGFFGIVGKLILLMIQGCTALCLLPLGICTIALAVLFGIEIYLVFLGSSVLGFALITLAVMILISEIASLIWKLVGGSKRKLRTYGINFLICAVLFGCGAMLSVKNIADFQIVESPLITENAVTRSYSMALPEGSASLALSTANIEVISDSSLSKDQILIHYTAPAAFHVEQITQQDNSYTLHSWLETSNEFEFIQDVIKVTFEGLKDNILYQYTEHDAIHAIIYVHPDLVHRITVEGWEVYFE